jgi:hypothetical protein
MNFQKMEWRGVFSTWAWFHIVEFNFGIRDVRAGRGADDTPQSAPASAFIPDVANKLVYSLSLPCRPAPARAAGSGVAATAEC